MPIAQKTLTRFIRLASTPGSCSYNEDNKQFFLRTARRILTELANRMGLVPPHYDLRTNKAGVAVSGEVTLHGEGLYVQFGDSALGSMFMYRSCEGRKDYTGGTNRWMNWAALENLDYVTEALKEADASVTPTV